jgi:hypothetical protein
MIKQTEVKLLFQEFRALSEATRKAGDEQSANLIDFLCEREDVAKAMEKEQKEYFFNCGRQYQLTGDGTFTEVYNETYGGDKWMR